MEQDLSSGDSNLDDLKQALLTHICTENKAFFKSQQTDEPDLNYDDRREIASDLLLKSHSKFLQRFGMNLKQEHLKYFESQSFNSIEQGEVADSLKHIKYALSHHRSIVRNRRYSALVKLIKDKKYFSEAEMMCRDPLLFDQLIGQYISPAEKKANRRPDPRTDTLVDVLLEGMDHDFNREVENQQRVEEENTMKNDDSQPDLPSESCHSFYGDSSDSESNDQWGNFDEPETSSAQPKVKKQPAKPITAGEKLLLREEFLGIMYSNFLSGKDTEFFDYATVDENKYYDDTLETDQDCEDKYFEEDSQESPEQVKVNTEDFEDELDIYMKHLEKHLKQDTFQEEFDE